MEASIGWRQYLRLRGPGAKSAEHDHLLIDAARKQRQHISQQSMTNMFDRLDMLGAWTPQNFVLRQRTVELEACILT